MQFPHQLLQASQLLERMQQLLDKATLQQLATSTGFIQRKSKLDASSFLQLCLMSAYQACQKSLSQSCCLLREVWGVKLRKQSLQERFNANAVAFLQQLVSKLIASRLGANSAPGLGTIAAFRRIITGDSTSFCLPEALHPPYRGAGGIKAAAVVKIYYEYDLKSGALLNLQEGAGVRDDTNFNQLDALRASDLVLKDLGFYQMPFLIALQQKGAYFISRLYPQGIVTLQGQTVKLTTLLQSLPCYFSIDEFTIELGRDKKLRQQLGPIRLIIERVAEAIREQKVRRLRAKAADKGRQVSQDQLTMCAYNVFITNASKQSLPLKQVRDYYRLRWQIELLFKTWKSVFGLHRVNAMQLYRFQCLLLGTLLLILLTMPLLFFFKNYCWRKGRKEVSEWKMLLWLRDHMGKFCSALLKLSKLKAFARKLFEQIQADGFKHQRKHQGKPTHNIPFGVLFQTIIPVSP